MKTKTICKVQAAKYEAICYSSNGKYREHDKFSDTENKDTCLKLFILPVMSFSFMSIPNTETAKADQSFSNSIIEVTIL